MSADLERDRSFERALKRTLASGLDSRASDACLDPETLAAWADGGLSPSQRASAERHAAGCARCQAVLAALVQTTPLSEPATPWWRSLRASWLVPLAAVATGVAIYVAVPERPTNHLAQTPVVPTTPPSSTAREQAGDQSGAAGATKARTPEPEAPAESAAATRKLDDKAPVPSPARDNAFRAPLEARQEAARTDAKALDEAKAEAAAPPPAPPASSAFAPVAAPQSASAGAPPASSAAAPAATPASPARNRAAEPAGALTADSVVRAALQSNAASMEILSPDPRSRWRITGAASVEHSVDGGTTWQSQPTGVSSRLTAGSAPSASVCWMVGPRGIVLISTDGRTWRRLPSPSNANLVSVRATDDQHASMTDANGRTFSTADAGRTWSP